VQPSNRRAAGRHNLESDPILVPQKKTGKGSFWGGVQSQKFGDFDFDDYFTGREIRGFSQATEFVTSSEV
jgi:hypothetical protein